MSDSRAAAPKVESRTLAALKVKAANLKAKIEKARTPESVFRAQRHLDQVNASIKKASK